MTTPDLFTPIEDPLLLDDYAQNAYLSYAMSVVKGRALPDVRDGLKPVQRRILFAMQRLNLEPTGKAVKSARVVGDVLSKFHPHGDQATYEALVRMAQSFSLRYPLVDGQGNFGSRDGDPAAAMRYTETRLTRFAGVLLDEIDAETVDFMDNYDGANVEPQVMPARLPVVLLNGASGIAVGLACELPPHNLREVAAAAVAWLKNPALTHEELMRLIPGPDFPGGAQIISSTQEISEAYASGRGRIKVRAHWKLEELARGQWQVVFTELPPQASTQLVLEEVEALTNPKPKAGKKTPSLEQQNLKAKLLSLLDEVRDESSRDAAVRLVISPKTSKVDKDELIQTLLAHTSLEMGVSLNLVVVGNDGRPLQKNLLTLLAEWGEFRLLTVKRRCQARRDKVLGRIHILRGRQLVLLSLDEVIATIRESDEPKPALIQRFALSDEQAEDILEMRLRQLARLESLKIERELQELVSEQAELDEIIGSDKALRRLLIKEIEQDAKKFGDPRRTRIEEQAQASIEAVVVDEPVTVIVSKLGWVRSRSGHGLDATQWSFKSGDALYGSFECRSVDVLVALDATGRAYSVPVAALPSGRGDGQPLTTLVDLSGNPAHVHYHAGPLTHELLFASSDGYGFRAQVADLVSRQRAGKAFFHLNDKASVLQMQRIRGEQVAVLSAGERLLCFALAELKPLHNGGRGVQLMELQANENLLSVTSFGSTLTISGVGRAGAARSENLNAAQQQSFQNSRARRGKPLGKEVGITFKAKQLG